jgi:uncharacterized repeat protein (TIGR03803 family)
LAVGNDANFYGVTDVGEANGYGAVFKVAPTGSLSKIVDLTRRWLIPGMSPSANANKLLLKTLVFQAARRNRFRALLSRHLPADERAAGPTTANKTPITSSGWSIVPSPQPILCK